MPSKVIHQPALNGGELSARMLSRSDVELFQAAVSRMLNFVPTIQGAAEFRPGTTFVKDLGVGSRLLSFRYSRTESLTIELADHKLRVYRDRTPVRVDPVVFRVDEINAGIGVFAQRGHGLRDGMRVQVEPVDGALPAWLTAGTTYYVRRMETWADSYNGAGDRHALTDPRGIQAFDVAVGNGPYNLHGWTGDNYPDNHSPIHDYWVDSLPAAGTVRFSLTESGAAWTGGGANYANLYMTPSPDHWYDAFRLSVEAVGRNRTYQSGAAPTTSLRIVPVDEVYVEVVTPWSLEEAWELDYAQAEDILIFTHQRHMPRVLKRLGNQHWELETFRLKYGPYEPLNLDSERKLSPTTYNSGSDQETIQLFSARSNTQAPWGTIDMVGRYLRARSTGSQIQWAEGRVVSVGTPIVLTPAAFRMQRLDTADFIGGNVIQTPEVGTWNADEEVRFFTGGNGTLPDGLFEGRSYYAIPIAANQVSLANEPGGAALVFDAATATGTGMVLASSWINVVAHGVADGTYPIVLCAPYDHPPEGIEEGVAYRLDAQGADFFQLVRQVDERMAFPMTFPRSTMLMSYESATSQPNVLRVQFASNEQIVNDDLFDITGGNLHDTSRWRISPFSALNGWPKVCAFVEQRLTFGNIPALPSTLWASDSAAFDSFSPDTKALSPQGVSSPADADRSITDSNSWAYSLVSGEMDEVSWITAHRFVLAATAGRIFQIRGSDGIITPTSRDVTMPATDGAAAIKPAITLAEVVYLSSSKRIAYAASGNDSERPSAEVDAISHHAEHALSSDVVQMCSGRYPWFSVYFVREDGRLYACVFDKSKSAGIVAWYEIALGGTNARVLSATVTPSADGRSDELWLVVSRMINGVERIYLEVMSSRFEDEQDQDEPCYLDASVSYDGSPIQTVTDLDHLDGETVTAVIDGDPVSVEVVGGQAVLPKEGSRIHVGLGYTGTLRILPVGGETALGDLYMVQKRWAEMGIRMHRTRGGAIRYPDGTLARLKYAGLQDPMDTPTDLFTGLFIITPHPEWTRDAQIEMIQESPFPMRLLSLAGRLEWNQR